MEVCLEAALIVRTEFLIASASANIKEFSFSISNFELLTLKQKKKLKQYGFFQHVANFEGFCCFTKAKERGGAERWRGVHLRVTKMGSLAQSTEFFAIA